MKRILEPIEEVISDLAVDGFSFRKIVENKSIRNAFTYQGYEWPKSAATAQKYLISYSKTVKDMIKNDIATKKKITFKFSLSKDEYSSSVRGKR